MVKKLFLSFWIVSSFCLFLYSYTQVDLSLTLSRASIYQTIEKEFQYVGWFNRPLSTLLYIGIFVCLFGVYFWTMEQVSKNKISRKALWIGIIIVTCILALSYNAFSYDLFNYIFDAKIITVYHQNPYLHRALDFPHDPMLSFMHWTQRTYPYGPLWLALTVPVSFIGGNIFIITFYLFKILISAFFVFTVWSIEKIGKTIKLPNTLLPVAAFALNPFVLSESLVSAHNDIVMMGIALFGVYFVLQRQYFKGVIFYVISAGLKFATALLIISYALSVGFKKKNLFLPLSVVVMIFAVVLASLRTTFQPWYLLYVFPFAVLFVRKKIVKLVLYIFSIASVIFYIPFLFTGNWNPPIPSILNLIVIVAIAFSVIIAFFSFLRSKNERS